MEKDVEKFLSAHSAGWSPEANIMAVFNQRWLLVRVVDWSMHLLLYLRSLSTNLVDLWFLPMRQAPLHRDWSGDSVGAWVRRQGLNLFRCQHITKHACIFLLPLHRMAESSRIWMDVPSHCGPQVPRSKPPIVGYQPTIDILISCPNQR